MLSVLYPPILENPPPPPLAYSGLFNLPPMNFMYLPYFSFDSKCIKKTPAKLPFSQACSQSVEIFQACPQFGSNSNKLL